MMPNAITDLSTSIKYFKLAYVENNLYSYGKRFLVSLVYVVEPNFFLVFGCKAMFPKRAKSEEEDIVTSARNPPICSAVFHERQLHNSMAGFANGSSNKLFISHGENT